jgi:hypothetical protein
MFHKQEFCAVAYIAASDDESWCTVYNVNYRVCCAHDPCPGPCCQAAGCVMVLHLFTAPVLAAERQAPQEQLALDKAAPSRRRAVAEFASASRTPFQDLGRWH